METKSLLIGITSFIAGGLLVSIAATTFEKKDSDTKPDMTMSMRMSTDTLREKKGDDFDKQFISDMIVHHQGAIDMAELAVTNAKHDEIKSLAKSIIEAQQKEIADMQRWQAEWGYGSSAQTMHGH